MKNAPLIEAARRTTIIEAPRLARHLGVDLTIATETFQHTGSFKFRAAYNLASNVPQRKIITASSGNFGQAMAYACSLLGKSSIIVMPETSAQVKVDAVREYGGLVDLIDVKVKGRAERVAELAKENPDAYIASAYDDLLVIQGNASLGAELAALDREFDFVVAPIGGGGLASGIITGLRAGGSRSSVVGAEPLMANDAARSLRAGHIVVNETEPQTIADGARTVSVGGHNWAVLKGGLSRIVEVPEANIKEGVRLLFGLANLKAEPTGALAIGALLTEAERFRGRRVCCVISGGNVDPAVYREILSSLPRLSGRKPLALLTFPARLFDPFPPLVGPQILGSTNGIFVILLAHLDCSVARTAVDQGSGRRDRNSQEDTQQRAANNLFHRPFPLMNRVGGSLAAPVLPHHRTYGSVYGGSQSNLELSPLILQR